MGDKYARSNRSGPKVHRFLMGAVVLLAGVALTGCGEIPGIVSISSSSNHTCAAFSGGSVMCWGEGESGQLGDGNGVDATRPLPVEGITTAVAVAVGRSHSCALLADTTVQCWGSSELTSLASGPANDVPSPVIGLTDVVALDVGTDFACAVTGTGSVRCWGDNGQGQLGRGSTSGVNTTPADVVSITGATSVTTGVAHACARLGDGSVKCWGRNDVGQVGSGAVSAFEATPVVVAGVADATQIASSSRHTCATLGTGSVRCWGDNNFGQIGTGSYTEAEPAALAVPGITTATQVAAGIGTTCALLADGTVVCLGDGSYGELGTGSSEASLTPVPVAGISTADSIDAGAHHGCALLDDLTARCWGRNTSGEIGDGTTVDALAPAAVNMRAVVGGVTEVSAGRYHICALTEGLVGCWGDNGYGQLGDGTNSLRTVFTLVPGITTAVSVSAGDLHTCAALADGTVRCWGDNQDGQLGDGTIGGSSTLPVAVPGVTDAVEVTAGATQSCALLADQTVACWGRNTDGSLGVGSADPNVPVASAVVGLTDAAQVSAGGSNATCAVLTTGSLRCWGGNFYGAIGDGGLANTQSAPVDVGGFTTAAEVTVGASHVCARFTDGSAKCWGRNHVGQTGNGTTDLYAPSFPSTVTGLTGVTHIVAGFEHTCASTPAGLQCWGRNDQGQLGDGTIIDQSLPVTVLGSFAGAVPAPGEKLSCAVLTDQTVRCWGSGYAGNGAASLPDQPAVALVSAR